MSRGRASFIFMLAAFLFIALPAAAVPTGVALLTVEIHNLPLQDPPLAPVAATETDDLGYFSLAGIIPGDYLVVIIDPLSDLAYQQNLTVPIDLGSALLHGRVTSDMEVDVSFDVAASLLDEADSPLAETFDVKLKYKWNGNNNKSNGKLWVFVRGDDVGQIENVVLSSDQGSLEAAVPMKTNDGQTKLMAEFSKGDAYLALVPPGAVRGDTVEITISVVTPAGTQDEVITVRILGKK